MAVIYPKEGRVRELEELLVALANWTLRLFKNNLTPDVDTEIGDFTEADFSGYAGVNVTWGWW